MAATRFAHESIAAMAAPTEQALLESRPKRHHHPAMASHAHACIDPKHHVHDAAGFVGAVERACRERGLRLTPIRARVLGLIADAGRPLKAYDLLDQVREGEGAGCRRAADRVPRARLPARQRLHPQAAVGQRFRRLPPSEHRAAFGAVPDLRPLPQRGRARGPPRRQRSRRARARARLRTAGADAGSARPVRALQRRVTASS